MALSEQDQINIIDMIESLNPYETLEFKRGEKGEIEWTKKQTKKGRIRLSER